MVPEVQVYLAAADAALGCDCLQVYEGVAGAGARAEAAEGARAAVERDLKGAASKGRCGQLGQAAQLVAGRRKRTSGCLEGLRRAPAFAHLCLSTHLLRDVRRLLHQSGCSSRHFLNSTSHIEGSLFMKS